MIPKGKLHFLEEISNLLVEKSRLLPIQGGIAKAIGNNQILKLNQQNVNSTGIANTV
jgi:hypothetical protein